jgi:hypothetical protein
MTVAQPVPRIASNTIACHYPSPAMRIGLIEMARTLGVIAAHDIAPCRADALISLEEDMRRTVEDVVVRVSTGPLAP